MPQGSLAGMRVLLLIMIAVNTIPTAGSNGAQVYISLQITASKIDIAWTTQGGRKHREDGPARCVYYQSGGGTKRVFWLSGIGYPISMEAWKYYRSSNEN